MKLSFIREILLYNTWANERLLENVSQVTHEDYLKTLSIPFNNLHGLLVHLHYYDVKLYHKVINKTSSFKANEKIARDSLSENILIYSKKWNEWVATKINSSENFENNLKDLFDLYAHNNYHRGQINVLLSILGYKPQSLDIYLYESQQLVANKR